MFTKGCLTLIWGLTVALLLADIPHMRVAVWRGEKGESAAARNPNRKTSDEFPACGWRC